MSPSARTRPGLTFSTQPVDARRLSGQLNADGSADLEPTDSDDETSNQVPSRFLNGNKSAATAKKGEQNGDQHSSDEEDYDEKELDTSAIISGSRGGELEVDVMDQQSARKIAPRIQRRTSIPIMLEKTGKKGRYLLTANDPEIREILRRGLERANEEPMTANKRRLRDLVFTRRFTTFDRQNPAAAQSTFHGFFTLFWLCMALMLVRLGAYNYKTYGNVVGKNEVMKMMFKREVVVLGLTDAVMCAATAFGLVLQKIILKGWLNWNTSGWIIQNIWQASYLGACVGWTFYREWPWTHTIFIVLHALVFVMKQHSYAFYNGYLSQVYKRKVRLEQKFEELHSMSPVASPVSSPKASPSSAFDESLVANELRQRRKSQPAPKVATNLSRESSEMTSVAAAISSGEPLDPEQMTIFSEMISSELTALDTELKGKCTVTENHYPKNLTVYNWAEWTCFPTLVYELEYPRQDHINWWYVAEKTLATFGCLAIMMAISQGYIYPPVKETVRMKEAGMPLQDRWNEFPWLVSDMLFPLLLEQLLTWYVIWECILNVLAELTRFADRGFYGDWWNSVSWDQYARDWNRPVHNFLLRHVYHSSISALRLSKMSAMFVTFLLSACVHELLMFCLFKKVRGYLFTMQLLQLPLAALSRTKLLKNRDTLGNVVFWMGLFVGPSFLTSLYLVV